MIRPASRSVSGHVGSSSLLVGRRAWHLRDVDSDALITIPLAEDELELLRRDLANGVCRLRTQNRQCDIDDSVRLRQVDPCSDPKLRQADHSPKHDPSPRVLCLPLIRSSGCRPACGAAAASPSICPKVTHTQEGAIERSTSALRCLLGPLPPAKTLYLRASEVHQDHP